MTATRPVLESLPNWRAALEHEGEWTEEEYDALPDGLRAELHDGKLTLTPPPTADHQVVQNLLFLALLKAVGDVTRVLTATDVRLANGKRRRIPDLMVVRENYHGSPTPASNVLLVIEIVSPGGGVEWTQKMTEYAEGGIPGYLIIEGPKGGYRASHHVLRDGKYELATKTAVDGNLTITEPIVCDIDLSTFTY